MRKLLILSVLALSLFACDKEKSEETPTDVTVTDASQDAVGAPDAVTPADDVTASVDATPVSSTDVSVAD